MAFRDVTGTFTDPAGNPLANGVICFMLDVDGVEANTQIISAAQVDVKTDSAGMFTQSLWVNDSGTTETSYTIRHPSGYVYKAQIPSGVGSIDITELFVQNC